MGLTKTELFSPEENHFSEIFRTLAHPCRVRIIITLLVHESKTVGQLTESFGGVAQSTISEHLRHLKDAGLISGTRVQNSIRYSLNRPIWDHVRWVLSNVCNDTEFTVFYR